MTAAGGRDFFAAVGLDDMLERGGLPETATPVGGSVGHAHAEAAAELWPDARTAGSPPG